MNNKVPKGSYWIAFYIYYANSGGFWGGSSKGNGYRGFTAEANENGGKFLQSIISQINEDYGAKNCIITGLTRIS